MAARKTLSVVLITKNAGHVLADCLASVDWADELIIVDSGSDDNTVEIAKKAGAKVYHATDWQGFGKQRQRAQHYATSDYIFMLDADERVTPTLKQSIEQILQQPDQQQTVYSCSRRNLFLDRFMHHSGWYPDRVVRLYPRQHYQYNDQQVHEALQYHDATVLPLTGDLLHLTCQDYMLFQRKQLSYAQAWAQQKFQHNKPCGFVSIWLHALAAFIKTAIIRGGFLDGKQGWLLACVNAQYTFNKYAALWALYHTMRDHHEEK